MKKITVHYGKFVYVFRYKKQSNLVTDVKSLVNQIRFTAQNIASIKTRITKCVETNPIEFQ